MKLFTHIKEIIKQLFKIWFQIYVKKVHINENFDLIIIFNNFYTFLNNLAPRNVVR